MKKTIFNLLFAGLLLSGAVLTGCSKSETISDLNNKPQSGELNVQVGLLNQNLAINYAKDGSMDITQQFEEFTFRFTGTYPSGVAQVWNDLLAKTGSWSTGEESTDFSISYPTDVFTELSFLNRTWTIGESSSAVIRLIAGDDEVHFSAK